LEAAIRDDYFELRSLRHKPPHRRPVLNRMRAQQQYAELFFSHLDWFPHSTGDSVPSKDICTLDDPLLEAPAKDAHRTSLRDTQKMIVVHDLSLVPKAATEL